MWILPKNLSDTYPYVQVAKESGLDCEEFSRLCTKSLSWNAKHMRYQTWLRKWNQTKYIRLLSIRTLEHFRIENFEDAWISLVGGSRALPSVSVTAGAENQPKTHVTSSRSSLTESRSADQQLSSSKMSRESSHVKRGTGNQFSNMSLQNWNQWVSKQRQEYSRRVKLAPHTKGKGSSSWHTPNTMDSLPPRSEEALRKQARGSRKGRTKPATLREQVNPRAVEIYKEESNGSQGRTKPSTNGKHQEQFLNPSWAEQLMGMKRGWTQLPIEWNE